MRLITLACILTIASSCAAEAGAWLREKGAGFASVSLSTTSSGEPSTSIYLEYGLTENRTIGADLSYGVDRTGFQEGSGILFLRVPLGPTDKSTKWATHFGIGTRYIEGFFLPAAEAGLSWGRGIKVGDRYGWANIDTSLNIPKAPADDRIKIDGTVGLGWTDRTKVMLQVFNTIEGGETYSRLAPSLLFAVGRGGTTLQVSTEIPIAGGGDATFKLGVWRDF